MSRARPGVPEPSAWLPVPHHVYVQGHPCGCVQGYLGTQGSWGLRGCPRLGLLTHRGVVALLLHRDTPDSSTPTFPFPTFPSARAPLRSPKAVWAADIWDVLVPGSQRLGSELCSRRSKQATPGRAERRLLERLAGEQGSETPGDSQPCWSWMQARKHKAEAEPGSPSPRGSGQTRVLSSSVPVSCRTHCRTMRRERGLWCDICTVELVSCRAWSW